MLVDMTPKRSIWLTILCLTVFGCAPSTSLPGGTVTANSWTPPNTKYPPPKEGEPPLHRAARTGDHEAIRRLVGAGADVNVVFDMGLDPGARPTPATPLMVAAGSGDGASVETVRLLLELGAEPTAQLAGSSAARFAATGLGWNYRPGGDAERLKAMLDAGSPLTLGGEEGARVVGGAAAAGDAERLRILLGAGGSPHAWFDAGEAAEEQAAFRAIYKEHVATLPEELDGVVDSADEVMAEIDEPRTRPWSYDIPLFQAAEDGSAECIRLLLDAGADIGQLDNSGRTALFYAASADAARALGAAAVDLGRTDNFGKDALQYLLDELGHQPDRDAALTGAAHAMIEAGVPLVVPAEADRNRLYHAAFSESPAAVRFLLNAGHPVDPDPSGVTALHGICWHWDHDDEERNAAIREIVRMLLDAGVDPNARDDEGNTPLHECVAGDGANIVAAEVLVAAGADLNARNNDGQTPLVYLYETHFEYAKVVPFLLKHGADPLIPNSRGQNAIDIARAAAAGEEPHWREEMLDELPADHPAQSTGWKAPAEEGDDEHRMLRLMEEAVKRDRP